MIKTALKHWIYELCIDQLFNAIKNNFLKNNTPSIGDVVEIYLKDTGFNSLNLLKTKVIIDSVNYNHIGISFIYDGIVHRDVVGYKTISDLY